jgi:toxin YoeB
MQGGTRLVSWQLAFTRQAQTDANEIAQSGLMPQVIRLLDLLRVNPFQNPPPCENLVGDLSGAYSRRINIQHRLIYQILKDVHMVKVIGMWTHYDHPWPTMR